MSEDEDIATPSEETGKNPFSNLIIMNRKYDRDEKEAYYLILEDSVCFANLALFFNVGYKNDGSESKRRVPVCRAVIDGLESSPIFPGVPTLDLYNDEIKNKAAKAALEYLEDYCYTIKYTKEDNKVNAKDILESRPVIIDPEEWKPMEGDEFNNPDWEPIHGDEYSNPGCNSSNVSINNGQNINDPPIYNSKDIFSHLDSLDKQTISDNLGNFDKLTVSKNKYPGFGSTGTMEVNINENYEGSDVAPASESIKKRINSSVNQKTSESDGTTSSFQSSFGNKMLRMMGWDGGGLGKDGSGIKEPIMAVPKNGRFGFGHRKMEKKERPDKGLNKQRMPKKKKGLNKQRMPKKKKGQIGINYHKVSDEYEVGVHNVILYFLYKSDDQELIFSNSLTRKQRKYIHETAHEDYELSSMSFGKNMGRYLVLFKASTNKEFLMDMIYYEPVNESEKYYEIIPPRKKQYLLPKDVLLDYEKEEEEINNDISPQEIDNLSLGNEATATKSRTDLEENMENASALNENIDLPELKGIHPFLRHFYKTSPFESSLKETDKFASFSSRSTSNCESSEYEVQPKQKNWSKGKNNYSKQNTVLYSSQYDSGDDDDDDESSNQFKLNHPNNEFLKRIEPSLEPRSYSPENSDVPFSNRQTSEPPHNSMVPQMYNRSQPFSRNMQQRRIPSDAFQKSDLPFCNRRISESPHSSMDPQMYNRSEAFSRFMQQSRVASHTFQESDQPFFNRQISESPHNSMAHQIYNRSQNFSRNMQQSRISPDDFQDSVESDEFLMNNDNTRRRNQAYNHHTYSSEHSTMDRRFYLESLNRQTPHHSRHDQQNFKHYQGNSYDQLLRERQTFSMHDNDPRFQRRELEPHSHTNSLRYQNRHDEEIVDHSRRIMHNTSILPPNQRFPRTPNYEGQGHRFPRGYNSKKRTI